MDDLLNIIAAARKRLAMIADFGDPNEIAQEPEEFGGTDDGLETVCMAYENMQCIAQNGLAEIDAALRARSSVTVRGE